MFDATLAQFPRIKHCGRDGVLDPVSGSEFRGLAFGSVCDVLELMRDRIAGQYHAGVAGDDGPQTAATVKLVTA